MPKSEPNVIRCYPNGYHCEFTLFSNHRHVTRLHRIIAKPPGAALNHCFMVLSVMAAREQARLVIKRAQCA